MRAPELRIFPDELIVDNFAGGGGASLGIEWALGRSPDIAINHDAEAIALHAENHPETRHYCNDVWKVDPVEACRGRPVGLAWFSPDCKHFSKAKGGKPVEKKIRDLAWVVVRWAKAVRPRVIILENVEEFADWGPLLETGMPCPLRKGLTYRRWRRALETIGYRLDERELVAADYGTPTTRKRLFIVARRDGLPIVWPDQTHDQHGRGGLPGWIAAAECIDFLLPTYSIFLTKEEGLACGVRRPLADNTERRIARGLKKFVLDAAEPFIVPVMHGAEARAWSIREPMRTITGAHRGDRALVTPFLTEHANASSPRSFPIDEPLRTQCAQVKGGHFALVAPYMVPRYGEDPDPRRNGGLGQEPRALSVEKPMPTIVPTQNHATIVSAFLAKHYGGHETPGSTLRRPIDTVTAQDHNALVASSLVKLKGTSRDGQALEEPLHTVQAGGNHYAEVRAFLIKFYSEGGQWQSPAVPMHTIPTKDRLGLVTVHGTEYQVADIGMRMLVPRELYRAQGFPDTYRINAEIDGVRLSKKAQVRMVGNSVCPPLAAAIARAQFEQQAIEVVA
jgi:DNA (cytosine-5)-methyltransferase 1